MTLDLDTFLTALYTIMDDLYSQHYAHRKPLRPGRRPELSDSEVLTLTICAQWFGTSDGRSSVTPRTTGAATFRGC